MLVKNLGEIDFELIMDCFLKSFKDYFVEMPTNINYYKNRWKVSKVNYNLSYGMFVEGNLVGFILNAIDEREGELIAFNTGTGVIPKYRGKRILKSIYEYALSDLKKKGITKCSLEVISQNSIAIKSYQGIGFKICKTYKCYKGEINISNDTHQTPNKIEYAQLNWRTLANQNLYSWDNHYSIIKNGNYDYYQLRKGGKLEGYFVIDPSNGYVAQFEVIQSSYKNWRQLFSAIKNVSSSIKINNIDGRLSDKMNYVHLFGLVNTVNQYEMEMKI